MLLTYFVVVVDVVYVDVVDVVVVAVVVIVAVMKQLRHGIDDVPASSAARRPNGFRVPGGDV